MDLPANEPRSYTLNLKYCYALWVMCLWMPSNTNTSDRLSALTEAHMHACIPAMSEWVKENDTVAYTATSKTWVHDTFFSLFKSLCSIAFILHECSTTITPHSRTRIFHFSHWYCFQHFIASNRIDKNHQMEIEFVCANHRHHHSIASYVDI